MQHTYAVPQILKACPIYLSHFPNILAISQISKSFLNYFSSNSSHEKSREYQRVYRNRSVGTETPAASGRGHRAAKRAKANTNQEVDTDTDMDDQSDGEIVDDSVSAADSETNLLDELDRDLHDQEITAPPVAESLANLASNRFLSSMSVEKVRERMEK